VAAAQVKILASSMCDSISRSKLRQKDFAVAKRVGASRASKHKPDPDCADPHDATAACLWSVLGQPTPAVP
jgi:hypothetical protein